MNSYILDLLDRRCLWKKALLLGLLSLFLCPSALFAHAAFRPMIKNYGAYKTLEPGLKAQLKALVGHVPRDVEDARIIRPMAGRTILSLSVVLPLNHEDELDEMLIELSKPGQARYQKFLSQEEFILRYAPTQEQVSSTKAYLESKGFIIEKTDPNRLILHVRGSVDQINKVFNTEINHYVGHNGDKFYAPHYELQVEKGLYIQSIQGLENRIRADSKLKRLPKTKIAGLSTLDANLAQAQSPASIRAAYSVSSNYTGSGQTLALFELDGYNASDIIAYENAYGLPHVPLQNILVDGFDGSAGEGGGEVTLDIELMIALAPGVAKILVYEGPNTGKGLLDTYNKIATDNLAKSISSSWGLSETANTGSLIQAENAIFKQMAAQGQSMFAASGDSGAYDDGSSLTVDDPASQPFVVGVGGTTLYQNSNGSYLREKTWSSGNGPGQSGGGGGISALWPIPPWQQGVISSASGGSTTMRNVPDVALDADPSTGYAIYYNGQWQVFGGTSCAAPLWAAFTALVNEARANAGKGPLGFANPSFYKLGQSSAYNTLFNDINDKSTNGYYAAVSGYDLATGWGSFKGDSLLASLNDGSTTPVPPTCTQANPSITITPASAQGATGDTLSYAISVLNNDSPACSASSFNLDAVVPSDFSQNLSQKSLSIMPQQSGQATLTLTSSATSPVGSYNFSLNATNASMPSFTNSVTGTYVVADAPAQPLSLSISPENGLFPYNTNRYANFTITLKKGSTKLSNNKISLRVQGPNSWSAQFSTGSTGSVIYSVLLNHALPIGRYTMTLSSQYNGSIVSKQTTFTVLR